MYNEGKKEDKSPDAIGGMKLDTYEYFDSTVFKGKVPSFVTTSQTVLINHPSYGYVYNYVKIKIKIDGSVEITARYLKQKKFSSKYNVVMDETFKGKINEPVDYNKDGENKVTVTGKMEIHGVTKDITIDGILTKTGEDLTMNAKFKIRSEI